MKRIFLLMAATILGIANAHADGGWVSGGGELIRDGHNPWFVSNVSDVNYCIDIDDVNFGQSRVRVQAIVQKVIENWKSEFQLTQPVGFSGNRVLAIATQSFHEVPCSSTVDIRLQFGVLSGAQIAKIGDPTKFLGISVRTDYDPIQLRGKGFVYISPSNGPLKFADDKVISDPWLQGDGALLYAVLLHEFGHVFGLVHSSSGFDIMNERFAETIVDRSHVGTVDYFKSLPPPRVFGFPDDPAVMISKGQCSPSSNPAPSHAISSQSSRSVSGTSKSVIEEFYGLPSTCFEASFGNKQLKIFATLPGGRKDIVGTALLQRLELCPGKGNIANCEPTMTIWLPQEQQVFPGARWGYTDGPWKARETIYKGMYQSRDGKIKREIAVTIGSPFGNFKVTGALNGKTYLDVDSGY